MLFEFVVGKFANILTGKKRSKKNALLSTTYMKGHCLGGNGSFCELMIFAHFIFLRMKENPKQSEKGRKMLFFVNRNKLNLKIV